MKGQPKTSTTSVQPKSKKIKKEPKPDEAEILNYICGACSKGYKSYAALYFHIKRLHNGVKPPGTITKRPARPKLDINVQPGRPSRPNKDIDELQETEAYLETAQNNLMSFLGEKLTIMSLMGRKQSLELVEKKIIESYQDKTDKWTMALLDETRNFITEYKARDLKMQHLDFDEDFVHLDAGKSLRIIVWFMVWLAQIHVKIEFIPELCAIFSNIWRVLDEIELGAQDLDNKLVWKKIVKNCEGFLSCLPTFKTDTSLLNEFIQKVCHLVGKTFEAE